MKHEWEQGRDHWEDLGVYERMILEWMSGRQVGGGV
jgi:hypothetical protein